MDILAPLEWLPEDDAYQTFLEDEFSFEIALAAKGEKRLALLLGIL